MLWDDPPHSISLYSSTNAKDAGAGTQTTYTLAQAGIACLIKTADAETIELFAQKKIKVTLTVGIQSSYLTNIPKPGWKAVADDTVTVLKIHGISPGRVSPLDGIPPLLYLHCEELL